jgi:cell division protein FtsZ
MGDALRVTVVATGLGRSAKKQQPMTLLKTGTDNMPVPMMGNMSNNAGVSHGHGHSHSNAPDYSNLDTPAVWRSSRESASAHVAALQEKGVDTYDIPAFLRKQAD